MYRGTGNKKSEITYEAAARAGFRQGSANQVHVMKTRAELSSFHAHGVKFISHGDITGANGKKLPPWERPDVLQGDRDAKRLESYLSVRWHDARETQGTLPAR